MRVLVLDHKEGEGGGAGRYLVQLVAALREVGHRIDVAFVAPSADLTLRDRVRSAGAEAHEIGAKTDAPRDAARWLDHFIARNRPDVLHVNHGGPVVRAVVYELTQLRGARPRSVLTLHGPLSPAKRTSAPRTLKDQLPGRRRRFSQDDIGRFFTSFDHIVSVSRHNADDAVRRYHLDPARISYIPNGVDSEAFAPGPPRPRTSPIVIGTSGRLARKKRHDVLLRAFAQVATAHALELRIAGSGPEEEALRAVTRDLGIDPIVSFLGYRNDMPAFLRELDVFAMTSELEGLPYALLEAMACALPVVSTAVNEIPSVARDGREAILVPSGDVDACASGLARFAADPDLRRSFGERARLRVCTNFDLATWKRATTRLYESALSPHRSSVTGE